MSATALFGTWDGGRRSRLRARPITGGAGRLISLGNGIDPFRERRYVQALLHAQRRDGC